jgi:hypothetical protein
MVALSAERAATFSTTRKLIFKLQIDHAQEDGCVVFQDGSSIKADVIMHCTGYVNLHYPGTHFSASCAKLHFCYYLRFRLCLDSLISI